MVSTRLADAIMYELWVGSDGTSARTIYYSGPPWLIGKALFMKQVYVVKQRLGITKENTEQREAEESSMLRSALLELKTDFLEAGSSSSVPQFLSDASLTSTRCSKPKKQPKRERTEEEKTFRRRAGYFLVTQVVAVLVFLSVMSSNDFSEVEVDDEGFSYD
ncbi:hypothetical protein NC652_008206 [Populus alba x Populus x berolinensis]|nr:hypothetical protein NC652_008206 [Populus alba x Populus x berolinensis]